jgi:hypothetical protein
MIQLLTVVSKVVMAFLLVAAFPLTSEGLHL